MGRPCPQRQPPFWGDPKKGGPAVWVPCPTLQGWPVQQDSARPCPTTMRPGRPHCGMPGQGSFFKIVFATFLNYFFKALACNKGLGFFGGVHLQHPHFLKLAPTYGSGNSSKIHGEWRFHFISNFFFLNLEYTLPFISTIRIFVS
jgi:hypothetical protein